MLHLYGKCDGINVAASDSVCTALQLVNFWQDVEIDFLKNRIYLPQDEMARFGVSEAQIAARDASGGWWDLMQFQVERARALMLSGAPLALRLPADRPEIRTVVQGACGSSRSSNACAGTCFGTVRPTATRLAAALLPPLLSDDADEYCKHKARRAARASTTRFCSCLRIAAARSRAVPSAARSTTPWTSRAMLPPRAARSRGGAARSRDFSREIPSIR